MVKKRCTVIMPFAEDLRKVYEDAIKPAVENVAMQCYRVDEHLGPTNILRRIVEAIAEAHVIIADLSGMNANVFYELGIAHTLGKNVILLAQSNIPFDVTHYKVIKYSLEWGADKQLYEEIRKALGALEDWIDKPNNPVQDFLPVEARPVPAAQYHELETDLRKAQEALSSTQAALQELQMEQEQYQTQVAELSNLRQEYERSQAMRQLAEIVIRSYRGTSGNSADLNELLAHFLADVENKGEVIVDVPVSEDTASGGQHRAKITFRKVP